MDYVYQEVDWFEGTSLPFACAMNGCMAGFEKSMGMEIFSRQLFSGRFGFFIYFYVVRLYQNFDMRV